MIGKPFKPPSLLRGPPQPSDSAKSSNGFAEPPAKKRRISRDSDHGATTTAAANFTAVPKPRKSVKTFLAHRKPLGVVTNAPVRETNKSEENNAIEGYYTVLWRKFTMKKNKTWDGDGVLSVMYGYAHLQDADGREMGKTMWKLPLLPGSTLSVGGKDVEVDTVISKEDFLAGRPFLGGKLPEKAAAAPAFVPVKPTKKAQVAADKLAEQEKPKEKIMSAASKAAATKFRNPLLGRPAVELQMERKVPVPRHDPQTSGALVMKRPISVRKGKQIVDVVVDPLISRHLRQHQREGVQFMYECAMGMRESGEGAILADDMGLGKSLQTIALLWTLMKQNPVYEDQPVVKKALIVCPVTVVSNWEAEFRKWLGKDRIGVLVLDEKRKSKLTDFTMGKAYNVMIIGYEKLRLIQDDFKKGAPIDIVIADEGHRLKTVQNKAAIAIKSLNTDRRVILSGTLMQNDLSEFFATVDFVNPGLLGKYNAFKREFETPILKARQLSASKEEFEKGEARGEELKRLTSQFILRREAKILAQFLPPKTETVLFCHPTTAQAALYRAVLESPTYGTILGSSEASLQLINILKKICNSPSLLTKATSDNTKPNANISALLSNLSPQLLKAGPAASAKLQMLDTLLYKLHTTTKEKVVLVSNYTSTLDILATLLSSLGYSFLRLDGTTAPAKRQGLVDRFNNTPPSTCFAFLLSAKAGGAGINLIGASRLVLFDTDWNPATDLQAMARIHRDGQKNQCFIYRLLVKGAMDEKIFQRQVTKTGLADAVIDSKKTRNPFSPEELRDLFSLDETEGCKTHELLGCDCGGRGNARALEAAVEQNPDALPTWGTHMDDAAADEAEEEEDDELPTVGILMSASQVNMEEQERKIKERLQKKRTKTKDGQMKIQALMSFLHFDARCIRAGEEDAENLIEDQILLDCVKEEGSRIAYVFARTTGGLQGTTTRPEHFGEASAF